MVVGSNGKLTLFDKLPSAMFTARYYVNDLKKKHKKYADFYQHIEDNLVHYKKTKKPSYLKTIKITPKSCYENGISLAFGLDRRKKNKYKYCMGLLILTIVIKKKKYLNVIPHGWVVKDNKIVIDPTMYVSDNDYNAIRYVGFFTMEASDFPKTKRKNLMTGDMPVYFYKGKHKRELFKKRVGKVFPGVTMDFNWVEK